MITVKDIAWVAGLLEGEGCFTGKANVNPLIQLYMTDKDVVVHAAQILGCHRVVRCKQDTRTSKPLYRTNLYGRKAIGWMMTLYPLMGERRKAKIEELLALWKKKTKRKYVDRKSYSRGAEVVWLRQEVCHVR